MELDKASMQSKDGRVLITGGYGLLGASVCQKFYEAGYTNITVAARTEHSLDVPTTFMPLDLRERDQVMDQVKGFDLVVHLAATGDETLPLPELYRINVDATVNVFDACVEHSIPTCLYASSAGIYGSLEQQPGSEDSPMNARSPYEFSKKEIELRIPNYREQGLNLVNLRPVIIYGPGAPMFVGMIESVLSSKPGIGLGENLWPIVYVDDVAAAFVAAVEKGLTNEDLIIADKQSHAHKNIIGEIKRQLGKSMNLQIPHQVLSAASVANNLANRFLGIRNVVTKDKVDRLTRSREFSIAKAKQVLAYEPQTTLQEGIKATVDAYIASKKA